MLIAVILRGGFTLFNRLIEVYKKRTKYNCNSGKGQFSTSFVKQKRNETKNPVDIQSTLHYTCMQNLSQFNQTKNQ